jgi:hypothetical protein
MEEYAQGKAPGTENVPERMVLSGSNIETTCVIDDGSIENVVVGRLLSVEPHPDSDHLVICQTLAAAPGAAPRKATVPRPRFPQSHRRSRRSFQYSNR